MTEQKEAIDLTPLQLDRLYHDVIDLVSRHGCFSGSKLEEDNGDQSIELTACSYASGDDDLEVVATVYIRGERLKEIREGEE